ncbi:MAG: hypothetical protein ACXVHT_00455 [Methanobacterium sp.]
MENHKVTSIKHDKDFIVTESFLKLIKKLKSLKDTRGRIILIIGAPGTGKSSNIYHALDSIYLNYYEPVLLIDSKRRSSKEVYDQIYEVLFEDLHAKSKDEVFERMSKFDAILVADKFLDTEYVDKTKIGLAEWTNNNTILSIPFFLMWMIEALRHRKALKKINLVFQTAWTIQVRGIKYDLITDFGLFSTILRTLLERIFEAVRIEYSDSETIKIIKSHNKNINEEEIRFYIDKYRNKPRLILNDLEKKSFHTKKSDVNPLKTISKSK